AGIRPLPYLRTPYEAFKVIIDERSNFIDHTLATFYRSILGFGLGSAVGILVALLTSWSKYIKASVNPWIFIIKPIPVLALIPIFLFWFGVQEWGKILYISMACFFMVVVISADAIGNIAKIYYWSASSLGSSRGDIYKRIVLPAIMPGIVGGLRVAATTAPALALAAEFMAAKKGLGHYMIKALFVYRVDRMFASILLITFIAIINDSIIRIVDKKVNAWTER
ncbi:unnamed protein product, partial [marine sediment metagenome]